MGERFAERSMVREAIQRHFTKKQNNYLELVILGGILGTIAVAISSNVFEVLRHWAIEAYYFLLS